jgi:phosphate transport system substrate-binding protein
MRSKRFAVVVAALATLALVAAACGKSKPAAKAEAKALTGAGATFPAPLYQKWAADYQTAKGVTINYQAIGSGGGIQQITAKTVDFGASDAPMKDEELAAAPGIIHIPTVFGAVVVTYNVKGVASGLKLKPGTVAGIFLGKIKKWNDPAIVADNSGVTLPASGITVVHRSDGSGTTNIFTSYLSAVSPEWKTKVGSGKEVEWPTGLGGKGNDGVTGLVKNTAGGVGYVEVAFAKQNSLTVASIANAAGKFIEPTLDAITAAAETATVPDDLRFSVVNAPGDDAYPIAGATWLLVYKEQPDEAKGRALVNFLWWATHDGQARAEGLFYAKLPSSLVTKAEDKIKSMTFNGTSLYTV